jgi:hypothetical protein
MANFERRFGISISFALWSLRDCFVYGIRNDMSNKSELIQARDEIMAVLDAKLKAMPEWKAFRAMDRALMALEGPGTRNLAESTAPTGRRARAKLSYGSLGVMAITEAGRPVPTSEIVAFIVAHRNIKDPDSIRVNIQSALSRDARIQSVNWSGGRGWWFADREVPKMSGGTP